MIRNNVSKCPNPLQIFQEFVRYYSGCGYTEKAGEFAGFLFWEHSCKIIIIFDFT